MLQCTVHLLIDSRGWSRKIKGGGGAKAACEAHHEISGYILGCVNCICVNPCACSCSCQCSTNIMKEMNEATLFGFLVLKVCWLYSLSEWMWWLGSHHTLGSQEWFVQKWIRECSNEELVLWTLHTQGVAGHPIHPPPPPPLPGSAPGLTISTTRLPSLTPVHSC